MNDKPRQTTSKPCEECDGTGSIYWCEENVNSELVEGFSECSACDGTGVAPNTKNDSEAK